MQASSKRPNSRELILDAVAERAGISKGGLLYNYATKEALLQAMIARHVERIDLAQAKILGALPPGPGRELKACLLTSLDREKCAEDKRLGISMIAASANEPHLLEPIRELQRRRLGHLLEASAAGIHFERAAVVSLAVDGLLLTEVLQTSPYAPAQRRRVVAELMRMIDAETSSFAPAPAADTFNPPLP